MKFFVVFVTLAGVAMAQRPTYAGLSPKLGPELASRFRNPNDTADSTILANRLGEDTQNANLPTDARGDGNLVNKLNQWPREHRPFWLINAEHIERHRHPDDPQNVSTQNGQVVALNQGQAQGQAQAQNIDLANRNNFANNDGFFEVVNGVPGTFDRSPDGIQNINFASRGGFNDIPETRPIKPTPPRSSFLSPLN